MPDPDEQLAATLDRYLSDLNAGRRPDRAALLRQHPELAGPLQCIERLDRLAADANDAEAAAVGAEPDAPHFDGLRHFGPYELVEEIGRGGMGVVYKARQKDLDRLVAVKMILANHLASAEHVRRFQAEARAAARVRHPNIVHIHEVGQQHGQHYFAMEYVEGQSLAERLAAGPIAPRAAACLLAVVARAIDHLHRQGVVHRDLKPSNILVDADDEPCITDFGLAKVFALDADRTATGVVAGTPSYMSPEQAAGRNEEIGPASDIYSLGAILYEMLTGRPPFQEATAVETLLAVLHGEPPAPRRLAPQAPRALELVCLKCLSKSPADRYETAAAVADDLKRFVRGEPLAVRPPGVMQRLGRWARRQPALASHLGGLGLFYAVELTNYLTGWVDADFHRKATAMVVAWAAASVVCQSLLDRPRLATMARFAWGGLDVALLLAVLWWIGSGVASPLVVVYLVLIVASSLWFEVRYVWYMTALSLVSYGLLTWDAYRQGVSPRGDFDLRIDRHLIFLAALLATGAVTAYVVGRVRALSDYYARPQR